LAAVAFYLMFSATPAVTADSPDLSTWTFTPLEQAMVPPAYEAGVMRMEVVDHDSPFDVLHGIDVGPRILVGEVFYPIEPGSGGTAPTTMAYYYDTPAAYARTVAIWFGVPEEAVDGFLGLFGTSIAEHMAAEREGINANAPMADGSFPILLLFQGAGGRGHQADDLAREYARRGYIVVALDTSGVSVRTPIGRALDPAFTELINALSAIPCPPVPGPTACYDIVNGEYVAADRGGVVWTSPFALEQYVVQRAYDAVAMIETVKSVFGSRADDSRVGIFGISLGGPPTYMAPTLVDALRGMPHARYAGYAIVPGAFTTRTIGMDNGKGGLFGETIGAILCQGDPACDPLVAATQIRMPLGFTLHQEDQRIILNRERFFYFTPWPGYGPGLTDEPSESNRTPANLISFEAIPSGIPAIYVEVPDSDHMDFTTDPLFQLFDAFFLPDNRVFTGEPYTPLDLEKQIEILVHYSVSFFDLTLKGKRGSLGALKTGRYNNVTEDGRDVLVRTKSLEVWPDGPR
jgi:predicted dienelactone hydrolase